MEPVYEEFSPALSGENTLKFNVRGEFSIFETNLATGYTVCKPGTNIILDTGREQLLKLLFNLGSPSSAVAICVGASTTAATVADTRLTHELIGNASRKTLTNTAGAALTTADVVTDVQVISGVTYDRKLVCQCIFDSADLNNNNQFGEYGLNTTTTKPGTPTSTSGVMINHYVDPFPTFKNAGNSITAQLTIRF